jgi:hypothetical protein
LPENLYRRIFNATFAAYRAAIRAAYARKATLAWLRRDERGYREYALVHRMMPFSLVGAGGLEHTYEAVRDIQERRIPGDFVELGVARGGCAALMALAAKQTGEKRCFWLFDSYEGLPEPTKEDFEVGRTGSHLRPLPKGSCLGTYQEVQRLLFGELHLERESINMVKGWFQDTVPPTRAIIGPIALLRIDADWYESVKICLDELYDQVSAGGYVIVDDYGTCFGARKAVDEFLEQRGIAVTLVHDGRGGCKFVKPGR